MIFKCLSIRQPWAEFIVSGQRGMEIRGWYTSYRGVILVHSPLKVDKKECERFSVNPKATGVIVGFVSLVEIRRLSARDWKLSRPYHMEKGDRPYGDDTYGWYLAHPKKFTESIPFKGKLGLFNITDQDLPPINFGF